jgi:hypothetical protein
MIRAHTCDLVVAASPRQNAAQQTQTNTRDQMDPLAFFVILNLFRPDLPLLDVIITDCSLPSADEHHNLFDAVHSLQESSLIVERFQTLLSSPAITPGNACLFYCFLLLWQCKTSSTGVTVAPLHPQRTFTRLVANWRVATPASRPQSPRLGHAPSPVPQRDSATT